MYVFWSYYFFFPNKQIVCKLDRTVAEFVEKPTDYAPMNLWTKPTNKVLHIYLIGLAYI